MRAKPLDGLEPTVRLLQLPGWVSLENEVGPPIAAMEHAPDTNPPGIGSASPVVHGRPKYLVRVTYAQQRTTADAPRWCAEWCANSKEKSSAWKPSGNASRRSSPSALRLPTRMGRSPRASMTASDSFIVQARRGLPDGQCENSHHRKTSTPTPRPTRNPRLHPHLR